MSGMEREETVKRNDNFMCGVVEGFYGRPWTTEQRKDLFQKMRKWRMDSYLYAPKDDYKHRAYWRELYTVEEADHLGSLVAAAKENDIRFIYAISPGLDIAYSSSKDVTALKRKLEQVNQLGCDAFAILFDDIDPEMSGADKEMFKSFAYAQVSVTNEVAQQFLSSKNQEVNKFLFCPTQYCACRAMPTVKSSEYLKTIGAKLDLRIDIMWTGPKVISKDLTIESIEEIAEVLRRPPVIWDNLHANDYDQKRIFLGPYSGRSPQLIPRLRGVLTNPNCEYGSNFVAIHTLAQWSRCSMDAKKKIEESMNPDAKLETESDSGDSVHVPENLDPHIYHPTVALKAALQEWLLEFKKTKSAWGPIIKPQIVSVPEPIPSINTCIAVTNTTSVISPNNNEMTIPPALINNPTDCSPREITAVENGFPGILTTPVMNSLAAENKIICADSIQSITMTSTSSSPNTLSASSISTAKSVDPENPQALNSGLEPMDTATETPPIPSPSEQMVVMPEAREVGRTPIPEEMVVDREDRSEMSSCDEGTESEPTPSVMNIDSDVKLNSNPATLSNTPSSTMQVENQESLDIGDDLGVSDLQLLCDLFYLPFEHGAQGLHILTEFQWLKTNSNLVAGISSQDKEKPEVVEWYDRAMKFEELTAGLNRLLTKLTMVNNRELLYELYPYLWDIRGVVSLLNSYIKWLGFSKGWKEAFMSGDQEPWVIRGGLTAEFQRLIPVDRGTDLYIYKSPAIPSSQTYTIRPYRATDESDVYKVCTATFKEGLNAADDFLLCPKFPGDLKVGGYLNLNSETVLNFVVEDENDSVVGIACGVLNGKEFRRKLNMSWLPMLKEKYPMTLFSTLYAKSVATIVHQEIMPEVPNEVLETHPAELHISIMVPLVDQSLSKRLLTCILAAFRSHGVFGCYVETPMMDKYSHEFYNKLGFMEMCPNFMVRNF